MWLVTAVGAVHGQNSASAWYGIVGTELSFAEFTFALEQKKSYTVGRDRNCDIRYESRHVRPREGSIVVGDWDPTNVCLRLLPCLRQIDLLSG